MLARVFRAGSARVARATRQVRMPLHRGSSGSPVHQSRSIVYLWKRYMRPRPEDVPKPISNPSMAQRYHDEITQLVNDNKHNEAIKKWDEMRLAGILPLEVSYKLAMRMFEQKGDVDGVLEAFDELQHNGYTVDQVSRNILLDMHMKRGDVMNSERVFKEMVQAQTVDLYAFNRVLDMYIMTRKKDRAQKVITEMKSKGFSPDSDLVDKLELVK